MESYLYHRVVDNMTGTVLYPLNQIKKIYPEVYKEHLKKYEGREHLLETKIPTLDCLWNDVLHFTAVPPQTLFSNISNAGFNAQELVWKKWFKVPAKLLAPENTIVCLYRRDKALVPEARDFYPFDVEKMSEYATVPGETIEYYKKKFESGERPLFFHRVPHILYKGTIETKGLEIVEV